jgi:hypothetical protein
VRLVVTCLSNEAGACGATALVQPVAPAGALAGFAKLEFTPSCDKTSLPSNPEEITQRASPKPLHRVRTKTGLRFKRVLTLKLNPLGVSLLRCQALTVQSAVTISRQDNRQLQPLTRLISLLRHVR